MGICGATKGRLGAMSSMSFGAESRCRRFTGDRLEGAETCVHVRPETRPAAECSSEAGARI